MMSTIASVALGEGPRSVAVRAAERAAEAWQQSLRRVRGAFETQPTTPLVNAAASPPYPRHAGVAVQLLHRLAEERALRQVALMHDGRVQLGSRSWRGEPRGARTLIVEGAFTDTPLPAGYELVLVIHDLTLRSRPHELQRARAAIFPSPFLHDAYRNLAPNLESYIIEPGVGGASALLVRDVHPAASPGVVGASRLPSVRGAAPLTLNDKSPRAERIAFVGGVKPHKGGALIPSIIAGLRGLECHVFGGGDLDLLRPLRGRASVHGYYRAGTLASLLTRHGIGLAILPSIVPESFSLTLSECWLAGVPVIAFDHGAVADRIREHGGGFLAPLAEGADGIAQRVHAWRDGASVPMPSRVPTARDAAVAHIALYRQLGLPLD